MIERGLITKTDFPIVRVPAVGPTHGNLIGMDHLVDRRCWFRFGYQRVEIGLLMKLDASAVQPLFLDHAHHPAVEVELGNAIHCAVWDIGGSIFLTGDGRSRTCSTTLRDRADRSGPPILGGWEAACTEHHSPVHGRQLTSQSRHAAHSVHPKRRRVWLDPTTSARQVIVGDGCFGAVPEGNGGCGCVEGGLPGYRC